MEIKKFDLYKVTESLSFDGPRYEKCVDELCKYGEYNISQSAYTEIFCLYNGDSRKKYDEMRLSHDDIRNFCFWEPNYKFNKNQMMNLKTKNARGNVFKLYNILKEWVLDWNDVDDIEDNLLTLSDKGIDYSLSLDINWDPMKHKNYFEWNVDINFEDKIKIEDHFLIISALKSLDKRCKGVKELRLYGDKDKDKGYVRYDTEYGYRYIIKHI